MKFVAENVISMTTAFSEEEAELLKRVMDFESQRTRKASTRKDALVAALKEYIDHHDPVAKAKRAEMRAQKIRRTRYENLSGQKRERQKQLLIRRRSALPAALIHAVHLRDQGRCTFISNSNRCGATRKMLS